MVSDEFSQIGILLSMSSDDPNAFGGWNVMERRINSSFGRLASWRVYRSGEVIESCRSGINGNCDTASDATARIILAKYRAASKFTTTNNSFRSEADALAADHLKYETVNHCMSTRFGSVCHWLAAGAQAAKGGVSSTDFGYTGYFPDAILAMQMACTSTSNETYCEAAREYQRQYLLAANFVNLEYSAPPGRSWRWTASRDVICTNTCSPVQWDAADAPRALAFCGVIQADPVPDAQPYCDAWLGEHMQDPLRTPLQFYPNGSASSSLQSGYIAQGLAAMFYAGWRPNLQMAALDSSLSHFSNGQWDAESCAGVYSHTFPIRALGEATLALPNWTQNAPAISSFTPPSTETNTSNLNSANEDLEPTSKLIINNYDLELTQELGPMQLSQTGGGYLATYENSDLQPIVEDGIGTVLASIVDTIDFVMIGVVVLVIVWLARRFSE
jgi:hypothetical protein